MSDLGKLCYTKQGTGELCFKSGNGALIYKSAHPDHYLYVDVTWYPKGGFVFNDQGDMNAGLKLNSRYFSFDPQYVGSALMGPSVLSPATNQDAHVILKMTDAPINMNARWGFTAAGTAHYFPAVTVTLLAYTSDNASPHIASRDLTPEQVYGESFSASVAVDSQYEIQSVTLT